MSFQIKSLTVLVLEILVFNGLFAAPDGAQAAHKKSYDDMCLKDAVVRVNGNDLLKQDVEDLLVLRNFLYCLQTGGDTTAPIPKGEIKKALPHLLQELIHHELFRQYAVERGIEPSTNAIRQAERQFLLALKKNPDARLSLLTQGLTPGAARLFLDIPRQNARDHLLRQSVTTNDLDNVSEEEIKSRIAFVNEFDANADKLNAGQRERLMKIRARILSGEVSFAKAAEESQVSPEHGSSWTTYELAEIPAGEDLLEWLKVAKVGEISEPMDLPDGLAIVKLVSKQKGEAPSGVTPPDTYTLVKCTMYAYQRMEYMDRPTMIRYLLKWKREEAQKVLGTMLTDRAKIEFPNGTDFFPEEFKEEK